MSDLLAKRWPVLLRRELAEHRGAFVKTPLIAVIVFIVLTLVGLVIANRMAFVGGNIIDMLADTEGSRGMNIRIVLSSDDEGSGSSLDYRIVRVDDAGTDSDWDFASEWQFDPALPATASEAVAGVSDSFEGDLYGPLLDGGGGLMNLILIIVVAIYLLRGLFDDRRDRSILFWKSMPVSEWEVVLSKLIMASLVVPLIFFVATLAMQLLSLLLLLVRAWMADASSLSQVLGQVDVIDLVLRQLGAVLNVSLWAAPVCTWLLLASAAARRTPFLVAVAPLLVAMLIEKVVFDSAYVGAVVGSRLSLLWYETAAFVPPFSAGWSLPGLLSLLIGLILAALMLWATVWLRRNRWEI